MSRSPVFQRPMARLALVAILLLALVPTLGRIAQAHAASVGATESWAALCTVQGLKSVPVSTPAHGAHDSGTPARKGSGDCDYCPLLAAAVAPAVATLAVPPSAPPAPLCTSIPLSIPATPHPCGLGSRGPPRSS